MRSFYQEPRVLCEHYKNMLQGLINHTLDASKNLV